MATQVWHVLIDDMTGKVIEEGTTVKFGIDGKEYEIDLASDTERVLRDRIRPFVEAARKRPKPKRASRGSAAQG